MLILKLSKLTLKSLKLNYCSSNSILSLLDSSIVLGIHSLQCIDSLLVLCNLSITCCNSILKSLLNTLQVSLQRIDLTLNQLLLEIVDLLVKVLDIRGVVSTSGRIEHTTDQQHTHQL